MVLFNRIESIKEKLKSGDFSCIEAIVRNIDLNVKEIVELANGLKKYGGTSAGETFLMFFEEYAKHNYENITEGIRAISPLISLAADKKDFPKELRIYAVAIERLTKNNYQK
ncbi:MAG: hypothetical protein QXG86_00460 [Candidatus Woesearchaeota archaeon]